MKFNSQICTTRSQSETLLKLGLKKETADMCHRTNGMDIYFITAINPLRNPNDIPAWSLHRLIEMMPISIKVDDEDIYLAVNNYNVAYLYYYYYGCEIMNTYIDFNIGMNIYDSLIHCIEWLIKEGHFNKEYLI